MSALEFHCDMSKLEAMIQVKNPAKTHYRKKKIPRGHRGPLSLAASFHILRIISNYFSYYLLNFPLHYHSNKEDKCLKTVLQKDDSGFHGQPLHLMVCRKGAWATGPVVSVCLLSYCSALFLLVRHPDFPWIGIWLLMDSWVRFGVLK